MNLKKILSVCFAALLAVNAAPAVLAQESVSEAEVSEVSEAALTSAEDDGAELMASTVTYQAGIFTFEIINSSEAALVGISGNPSEITIGSTIKKTFSGATKYTSYNITSIADGVCSGFASLEEVDLSGATYLKKIGENCFSYCPELTTVILPQSSRVATIGSNAFYYCPKLTTVTNDAKHTKLTNVGSSVFGLTPYMTNKTSKFVMLGDVLLKYNGTDTEVAVPDDTVAIADAFFGKPITSIDLKEVEYIGSNAFYGCRELETVSIPKTVTAVGDMAFSGCSSLKTVIYSDSLESIGFCSFANCPELTSFKFVGSKSTKTTKLTDIGECAFWNCRKLYYLDTGTITNVNVGSFWNCFGETPDEVGGVYYYKIPKEVETIAEGGYGNLWFAYVAVPVDSLISAVASTAFGSTSGATYVAAKNSLIEKYFSSSNYSWINYGDINSDKKINAKDIKKAAEYIARNIAAICKNAELPADQDVLNYDFGRGVIADINGDGEITTRDLYEIFQSIKTEYEAEQEEAAS